MGVTLHPQSAKRTEAVVRQVERLNLSQRRRSKRRWVINNNRFDRIKGLATADVATSDTTFTIDNVESTKGPNPLTDPSNTAETLTVQNTFSYEVDNNAMVFAEWHQDDDGWHVYQATCPVP